MPPKPAPVRQQIFRVFTKQYGLSLKTDASRYLEEELVAAEIPSDEVGETLERVARAYVKQDLDAAAFVDRETLKHILDSLRAAVATRRARIGDEDLMNLDSDADDQDEHLTDVAHQFKVVNSFEIPRWAYNIGQKVLMRHTEDTSLVSTANAKADIYRDRFSLIRQRILRNEMFSPPTFQDKKDSYPKITAIKDLLGRNGQRFMLFGMLAQLEEGKIFLEDMYENIELDLSCCKTGTGLFTDNCFVLVDGTYTDDDIFKVEEMGLPPPERRTVTNAAFGYFDYLGIGNSIIDETILEREEKNKDVAFVIISDVWLNQQKTLNALRTIFEGYSQALNPMAFILIGNFVSEPFLYNGNESGEYKDSFMALADLIAEFPGLASNTYFVFVPGPHDPWGNNILPHPPIPEFLVSKVKSKVKHAVFASNPCRIRYCTQDIVIFREDLLNKLRRNVLLPPNLEEEEEDITKHLIRTVLDQSHLCPLPLQIRPIYWAYDHTLRLYPLPHVLILADHCENYGISYEGCLCINPGCFPNSDFTWSIYYPASGTSERCALPS